MDINLIKKLEYKYFYEKFIKINETTEGYKIIDNIINVGCRVGPVKSISDGLFHEMGHFVEIRDYKRLFVNNFGLEIKTKVEVFGNEYEQPITWNSTKFESRVVVWQNVLCKYYKQDLDIFDFTSSFKYMPDFLNVPIKGFQYDQDKRKYLNSDGEESTYQKQDLLRIETIHDYIKNEMKNPKYTIDNFNLIWDERIKLIKSNILKESFTYVKSFEQFNKI